MSDFDGVDGVDDGNIDDDDDDNNDDDDDNIDGDDVGDDDDGGNDGEVNDTKCSKSPGSSALHLPHAPALDDHRGQHDLDHQHRDRDDQYDLDDHLDLRAPAADNHRGQHYLDHHHCDLDDHHDLSFTSRTCLS